MSSLKDLASLIMVPSLYKDGELHTVKPLADQDVILHPDATGNHDGNDGTTPRSSSNFTFSRGSNLAATRVDVNGLIEKGRENLLLQSNDFGTSSWTGSITETSGQAGYDGTNDAWLIENAATSAYIRQNNTTSGVLTASIYAKAGNVNWMRFAVSNSPIVSIYFDLVNGVGYGASNLISHKIEDVGGGWHRYSVSFLASSMSGMQWYPADGNNDLGEVGDNIYIQDAQLEQGLVATDYIETGATTAQAGILEDMPRLDYSGGASCPSLLLEPQRSNIIVQSEYFDGAEWQIFDNIVVEQNHSVSPQGLQNASKITSSGGTNDFLYENQSVTIGTTYTTSCFIKNIDSSRSVVYGVSQSDFDIHWNGAEIDSVDGTNVDYEDYGNGWYRVWQTSTATGGSSIMRFYPDNESAGGGSVLLYGYQVEVGSYPTSYIPTYGSSVTRNHDVCKITGSNATDIVNKPSMTLFAEFVTDTSNTHTKIMSIIRDNDGSYYNNFISFTERGDLKAGIEVRSGGSLQAVITSDPLTNGGLLLLLRQV